MWFEATARLANLPGRNGDDEETSPPTFAILVGAFAGGCVLLAFVAFAIYQHKQRKERGYSDTDDGGGGCFSCFRRRGGVNINGKVQILGLRRVSKERPVRVDEFEERPFYSNLMNLIMPQQTKDQDDWNMHRQMGHKPRRDQRNKAQPNDHNRKSQGRPDLTLTGERSYKSAPESVKALFSCAGLTDNTICHSAPTKSRRNFDDAESYNFTVETPFSEYTGRSSGLSTRQSSRYDDSTTGSSQSSRQFRRYDHDDSTASSNTYADDSYASSQSRPSARDRARSSKSKSTSSRNRSRYDRDRYDHGSVDSDTYADD